MIDQTINTIEFLIGFGSGATAGYSFALKTILSQVKEHNSKLLAECYKNCEEQKTMLKNQNEKLEERIKKLEEKLT